MAMQCEHGTFHRCDDVCTCDVPGPLVTVEDLDAVYRERAHLLAFLAASVPVAVLASSDPADWPVLTVATGAGQMCWHINPADLDLFAHVPRRAPGTVAWDGHSTGEKYERLRALVTTLAAVR